MSIPPEFLDQLRNRISVSSVVGRHVALKKRGREFVGLSPFNKERSPSFTVNDDKQFYHCFSSGKHGDIIGFVMEVEGLSFRDAVESLAEQAGLTVPKPDPATAARAERGKTLQEAAESACVFFERALASDEGRAARDYLQRRGISAEAIRHFRLGYAPRDRQQLKKHLELAGFTEAQMIEAGLVKTPDPDSPNPDRPSFSFFAGRLIFPVGDRRGRIVAFGARLLDGEGPKYLNSPDSPIFHKGQMLYNAAGARAAASRDQAPILIVEGYMDAIALHEAGLEAAVAPLGTALTEAQVEQAWQLASPAKSGIRRAYVCLDGDAAGQRAAFRTVERVLPVLKPDHELFFLTLPEGEDPDSLLRQAASPGAGRARFETLITNARPLIDLVWAQALEGRQLATPEAWAGLLKALEAAAGRIPDTSLAQLYRQGLKDRFYAARSAARGGRHNAQVRGYGPGAGRRGPGNGAQGYGAGSVLTPKRRGGYSCGGPRLPSRSGGPQPALSRADPARTQSALIDTVLALLIRHPHLLGDYVEALAALEIAQAPKAAIRDALIDMEARGGELDMGQVLRHVTSAGLCADSALPGSGEHLPAAIASALEQADETAIRRGLDERFGLLAGEAEAISGDVTYSS